MSTEVYRGGRAVCPRKAGTGAGGCGPDGRPLPPSAAGAAYGSVSLQVQGSLSALEKTAPDAPSSESAGAMVIEL